MGERLCTKCVTPDSNIRHIGNEFHFMMSCTYLSKERDKMLAALCEVFVINWNSDHHSFFNLMTCLGGDIEAANIVCRFVQRGFSLLFNFINYIDIREYI